MNRSPFPQTSSMDLISKQTRIAFREHLVGWTLRTISDLFDGAGVPFREHVSSALDGQRRSLVEHYYAAVDWTSVSDVRRVLCAYEEVLAALARSRNSSSHDPEWQRQMQEKEWEKLTNLLRKDGYVYEGGRLIPLGGVELTAISAATPLVDSRTLHDHIRRIEQNLETDPAQAIGSAKELVETVAKQVLAHFKENTEGHDLPHLVKLAFRQLNLTPDTLPQVKKGRESIRLVLAGLSQIVAGTAELRNLYGTGHGRLHTGGLEPRHARLVVGAAAALTRFLLDTLAKKARPAASP